MGLRSGIKPLKSAELHQLADPSFAADGNGNSVQYVGVDHFGSPVTVSDPMVSGCISTPEPSSLLLLGAGLATLLGAASKKRRASAAHCILQS